MIDFEDISLAAAKYAQNEPKCPFYDESDIYEKVYMAFKAGANYVLSNQSTATIIEAGQAVQNVIQGRSKQ